MPKDWGFWKTCSQGIPRAYAVLFFSSHVRLGWFLLLVSMLSPFYGVCGLLAVVGSAMLAWVMHYDRAAIRNGYTLFNALLIGLSLGYLQQRYDLPWRQFFLLYAAAVTAGFFLTLCLQNLMARFFLLSAHSMPAVLMSFVITLVIHSLHTGIPLLPAAQPAWMQLTFLPPMAHVFLQSFAAMLFQSSSFAGLLIFIAIVMVSPLHAIMASTGVIVGCSVLHQCGYPLDAASMSWCSFNFLLCGITLGAGYYIPSSYSLILVAVAAALSAFVSIALYRWLGMFQLGVSALPYNLTVLVMIQALRQRSKAGGLVPSPAPGMLPEQAAQKVLLSQKRFPFLHTPALFLPFAGSRKITQAFDDTITHRGAWQHAFDFEAEVDGQRYAHDGAQLEDFFSYGTAVLAPCHGVVTVVISHVPDNAPGANNLAENWGNYVMILCDYGYTVLLAHLQQYSATVVVGQRVYPGMLLGLCGNSGRSPVPHLHMQVQWESHAGAATAPFCLKHFIDQNTCYHTAGRPSSGSIVRTPLPHHAWLEAFSQWLPGRYVYDLSDGSKSWRETILLEIDIVGRYALRSTETGARCSAFLSEGVFYITDFQGDERSLLAWLAAGFARVPAIADVPCVWRDAVTSLPYEQPLARVWKEVIEPFTGMDLLDYEYEFAAQDQGLQVKAKCVSKHLPEAAAVEIFGEWHGRQGVRELRVQRAKRPTLTARLYEYQP